MSEAVHPPGWHGKLPSLGDFASRRLQAPFLEAWDGWLAAGLLALRERDPGGWLDAYLASPSWRFLLMPGVLPGAAGEQGYAGVLMPSVDRVGRYFPFTIVQPLGDAPVSTQQMRGLWFWLGRLDELAAEALHDDWDVDRLESELARMAGPDLAALAPVAGPGPLAPGALAAVQLPHGCDAAQMIGVEAQALWRDKARGLAYWFASTELVAGSMRVSRGLPAPAAMAALLGVTI
ncbi:type VI secretion system-associated protein TagF [Rubrivivax sp. RP6-9]|uniref:type VI secretion system-associated protein TagF n=1 Tax=Rubrivivax sp. RP6-9 TaxID=3415750 RepID=UPI003CC5A38E